MKFDANNKKNPDYNEEHVIYAGATTGGLKRIDIFNEDNPYKQTNLQNFETLTKDSRVTALCWADENENELLIGRGDSVIRTFDCSTNQFMETDLNIPESAVAGLAWTNEKLFAASADGKIHNLSDPEAIIEAGDNISQMRQCSSNSNIVAVGGKERKNNLKIYNLETQKQIFTSKNVPHDSLQLEVPVWDSDMSFVNDTENSIATCSRYGYIRLYDTRQQRRPVKIYTDKRDQAFNTMTERNGLIYVGTTMGSLYAFDLKSMKVPLHTYKGAVGSITSIQLDDTGKFLFTSSLDRFVRVHNAETTHQLYQCYLKIKPTQMVMKSADNILLNEYKIKKQASADVAVDSDQEYDELFKGMQKATDGNDDENVPGPSKKLKMKRHSGMIVGTKNKKAKV